MSASVSSLSRPWQLAFDAAWESMKVGSVPVGAVLTAGDGSVVSVGRSQASPDEALALGRLSRTSIAHAEINALAALPSGPHEEMVIWIALEPCLLCTGALLLSRVTAVHFAGSDPIWKGLDDLPSINPFMATRLPVRRGPRDDEFGVMGTLLPLLFFRERYPDGPVVAADRAAAPAIAALADALLDSDERRGWSDESFGDAFERLRTRLRGCVRLL